MYYVPPQYSYISNVSSDAVQSASDVRTLLLQAYLDRIIDQNIETGVQTAVVVTDLDNGQMIKQHGIDTLQYAASINKLPIARLVLHDLASGRLRTDQVLPWTANEMRAGAGKYDKRGIPMHATVNELLFDMLHRSGNTAVRVLVNRGLGGATKVNTRFKKELGLEVTALQPQDGTAFYVGNTTAREALQNMQGLLTDDSTDAAYIKHALTTTMYVDYGVCSQQTGSNYILHTHKSGILNDRNGNNRHDVGITYNPRTGRSLAYAFLSTAHGDARNSATAQANVSLGDMDRGVLCYSNNDQD